MYAGVFEILSRYWRAYGGAKALIRSPYLHLSFLLLALTYKFWSLPSWWDQVISVVPNLLGFTLGGFALFLGFGDEKFRALLAEPDDDDPASSSLYVTLCSTFVHFIVVQTVALLAALLARSWWFYYPWPEEIRSWIPLMNVVGGAFGYGFFLYAFTSVIAATLHVFRIATFYEDHQRAVAQEAARQEKARDVTP